MLRNFLVHWANNTIGVVVASYVLHSQINWGKPLDLLVAAFLLGILNTFIRPVVKLLTLPLRILTLGLFNLVINGALLYLVGWLMRPAFVVTGFWSAFWGALIISIVAGFLNILTGTSKARVTVRHNTPPRQPPDDGKGPIIDI